jgi:hypothetical protein
MLFLLLWTCFLVFIELIRDVAVIDIFHELRIRLIVKLRCQLVVMILLIVLFEVFIETSTNAPISSLGIISGCFFLRVRHEKVVLIHVIRSPVVSQCL